MRKVDMIILHCDANDNSKWGIPELRQLHEERGFGGIGYHYWINFEGQVYKTRPHEIKGCHVHGHNSNSIGICLHGKNVFFHKQMQSLEKILFDLCTEYKLNEENIFPHNYFTTIKTCPNFDVKFVKERTAQLLRKKT